MEMVAFQECWKEESLTFVKEEFYESIQAPMWVDFTVPFQEPLIDDNEWFCVRVGCDQKHGTLLDQTPNLSYAQKSQASKSGSFISKLPTTSPRLGAQLSTPTSKGKHRTPGKLKSPVMSAGKLRQKQCEENEDPNSTNVGTLNFKLGATGAAGFSTSKPSSIADGLDNLKQNPPDILTRKQAVAASNIALTPQNQSCKVTTAFSTPRIKKNQSVKLEPFRSNPALSKGMNTTARSKAVAPRRLFFETPNKFVKKTPSKDVTPATKHFSNPKKHVQFAVNDNKYSSPAKETARVCSTPCSKYSSPAKETARKQLSESPLLRVHNFSSSSRPKDSRKVTNHLRTNRKTLVSEQSNEKESSTKANVQETESVQGKVGSTYKDRERSENQSSIKQSNTGNDDKQTPPTYPGETSKGGNSKEILKRESGIEEHYVAQLASVITGKQLTYDVGDIEIHKVSESQGAEESISNQGEAIEVEQFFKGLRTDRENKKPNHPNGKIEIPILEDRENDDQSKFDVETDDCNLERRDNEAEVNSTSEIRVARETMLIKIWCPDELVSNIQNDSDWKNEIEILKDRKNNDESTQHVNPIDGILQEKENNDCSTSESVLSGRNMRVTEVTVLKSEFDSKHNEQKLEDGANKFVMYSAAANKGPDAENSIIIRKGSESGSQLEVDSEAKAEKPKFETGKHDGKAAFNIRHNADNLKEKEAKVLINSGPENEKAGEVLTISDCGNTRAVLESKGEKRTSGEMNSNINCSNGEACQDESCVMSALPTKVDGTSTPHAFNHKKIKCTLPRPFRLRTAERGQRKENGLNEKAQLAEENETPPMMEIRANKTQHEGKPKSKPKHIEAVQAKLLEDKVEEIKNIPEEQLHQRSVVKMPNFWKPPFKPMRSTKKLTTPKEPNFHPMHSRKYCTKGESSDTAGFQI